MAVYLDESVPADSEAVTLGASRIRQLKVNLDACLDQLFVTGGTLPSAGGSPPAFLSGWITEGGASGGASLFTPGAIQTADIAANAIVTSSIAGLAVTNAQIADLTITAGKFATGIVMPTASVATASIQNAAVGTNQIAPNAITAALLASGLIKGAAIGTYAGSNSAAASVSLSFTPTVVILFCGRLYHGFGISFLSEAVSGSSPVHDSQPTDGTPIVPPYEFAVQWNSGGFVVAPFDFAFNLAGQTHTYIALAI